jgi:hypothetical protein
MQAYKFTIRGTLLVTFLFRPSCLQPTKLVNSLDLAKGSRDRWKRQSDTRMRSSRQGYGGTFTSKVAQAVIVFCKIVRSLPPGLWEGINNYGWTTHWSRVGNHMVSYLPTLPVQGWVRVHTAQMTTHRSLCLYIQPEQKFKRSRYDHHSERI